MGGPQSPWVLFQRILLPYLATLEQNREIKPHWYLQAVEGMPSLFQYFLVCAGKENSSTGAELEEVIILAGLIPGHRQPLREEEEEDRRADNSGIMPPVTRPVPVS